MDEIGKVITIAPQLSQHHDVNMPTLLFQLWHKHMTIEDSNFVISFLRVIFVFKIKCNRSIMKTTAQNKKQPAFHSFDR